MSDNIWYEVHLAVMSLWTGIGLVMVYDMLRFFRIILPHNGFWVGVEDVGYWIYSGFMTFGLLYEQNDGGLRFYVIAGVFLGMLIYQNFVSRKLLKYLKNARQSLKIKLRMRRRMQSRWNDERNKKVQKKKT